MWGVNGLYFSSPPECNRDLLTSPFGKPSSSSPSSVVLLCTPAGSVWWRPGLVRQGGRGGRRRGPLWGTHCPGCYGNAEEPSGCCDCGGLAGRRSAGGDGFLGSSCQPVWSGDIWTGSHTYWYVNWMTSLRCRCDVIFTFWYMDCTTVCFFYICIVNLLLWWFYVLPL